jgi:hypothetical protein
LGAKNKHKKESSAVLAEAFPTPKHHRELLGAEVFDLYQMNVDLNSWTRCFWECGMAFRLKFGQYIGYS